MGKGRFGDYGGQYITETLMSELIALEIDYTILDSAASAAVAHGDAPIVVASRRLRKRNDQTAFRLRLRYFGEVGRRHLTAARRSGTIFFYTH